MKNTKLLILAVIAAVAVLSCTKKEAENVISIKRNSFEKITQAYEEFANNFFLQNIIEDNGYLYGDLFLTDYQTSGIFADPNTEFFIQSIIDNNTGIKADFANNKKAKEYRYSYKLKNFLDGEDETDIINIKIGKKNIEAASPKILDKTVFVPADSIGKALATTSLQNFFSYWKSDFSYDTLKKLNSIKPDSASQKRYNKAAQILYKNAVIQKTDENYFIEFNNDDILKYVHALVDAVKNDNRFKISWNIYAEEFKENIEEVYNTLIKDNIGKLKLTENLTVKNALVINDEITVTIDGSPVANIYYELTDYTNPLNSIRGELVFIDPQSAETLSVKCMTAGSITNTKADIDFLLELDSREKNSEREPETVNVQGYFYADTSISQENFKTGMYINTLKDTNSIDVHVSGNVEKTDDGINYSIDNMVLDIGDSEEDSILLETDANFKISKTLPPSFDMPNEKINILKMKPEDLEKLQNTILEKLQELSMQIRL